MAANPRVILGDNVDGNSTGFAPVTDDQPKVSSGVEANALSSQLKRETND
jgi:hypothetical protein